MSAIKIAILTVLLVACVSAASLSKDDCTAAATSFVEAYNKNAGDKYVKELDKVTGCWSVAEDLHMSLIMKTGNGYYKACLNVVVGKESLSVHSYGTCRH